MPTKKKTGTAKSTAKSTAKKSKKATSAEKTSFEEIEVSPFMVRVIGLVLIFLLCVSFLKYGIIGMGLHNFFKYIFGIYEYVVYVFLIYLLAYYMIYLDLPERKTSTIGFILIALGTYMIISAPSDHSLHGFDALTNCINDRISGGILGAVIYSMLSALFDYNGTVLFAAIIILAGIATIGYCHYLTYEMEIPSIKVETTKLLEQRDEKKRIKKEKEDAKKQMLTDLKKGLDADFEEEDDFDLMGGSYDEEEVIIPEIIRGDSNSYSFIEEDEPIELVTKNEMEEDLFGFDEIKSRVKKNKEPVMEEINQEKVEKMEVSKKQSKDLDAEDLEMKQATVEGKQDYSDYKYPSIDLLDLPKANNSRSTGERYARENAAKLKRTLEEFGVSAEITNIAIGPAIIKYELKLETGTRVNKISSLQDDIKLALATKDIRIEAPIPGKSAIGIEIPNIVSTTVAFREVLSSIPSKYENDKLLVPLGKDVTGNVIYTKLNEMPHLLIAGATGSGKSVCVNTIICSILMRTRPDEVKLLLVDPKKVELACYDGVAHLLRSVVTDPKKASIALRTIVEEMERRYDLFAKYNVRNMARYNEKIKTLREVNPDLEDDVLPFIVVILDELADLMMVASKDVEDCIMRITQMARAAGIHLIVATQRPSTDVITGVIKANIPSRIAFAVSSAIDSRTILDTSGADKLLGKGDMLYAPMGSSSPVRIQGAFVSDEEVQRIVDAIKEQKTSTYDDKFENLEVKGNNSNWEDDEDEEYEDCRDFVIKTQKASASLLQRQFHIGYNKAARIMDQLEANGVIGPQIGSKPREVYIRGYSEVDEY